MPLPSTNNVPPNDAATCTFYHVKSLLGVHAMSDDRAVQYLRTLVSDHDFPRPLPTALRKGAVTLDVHPRSRWVRAAVEAWFAGYIPPSAAATIDVQAMEAAAADMDAAALQLRLVGGRDYEGAGA